MLPKDINNITEPVYKRLKKDIDDVKENSSVVINASNIRALSDDELNALKVGDVVQKITGEQKHCYIVSYKQEEHGICLTYVDAGYMETVSYDYTEGHWVYNSTDIVEVKNPEEAPSGTIQDVLGLNASGELVKGAVSGGTRLCKITISFGTSYPESTFQVVHVVTDELISVYNELPEPGTDINASNAAKIAMLNSDRIVANVSYGNGAGLSSIYTHTELSPSPHIDKLIMDCYSSINFSQISGFPKTIWSISTGEEKSNKLFKKNNKGYQMITLIYNYKRLLLFCSFLFFFNFCWF